VVTVGPAQVTLSQAFSYQATVKKRRSVKLH
jgi:hypothetical protein